MFTAHNSNFNFVFLKAVTIIRASEGHVTLKIAREVEVEAPAADENEENIPESVAVPQVVLDVPQALPGQLIEPQKQKQEERKK